MQTENRLFDDLVRVMNGAAGTLAGVTREAQASFQERLKEWIGGMDFVGRDEFEAVKAMALTALDENEALRARIAALEGAAPEPPIAAEPPMAAEPTTAPEPPVASDGPALGKGT